MLITEIKEIEFTLTVMDDNNAKYKYQQKKRVNGLLLYKMKYQQTDKNNSNCYDQFSPSIIPDFYLRREPFVQFSSPE